MVVWCGAPIMALEDLQWTEGDRRRSAVVLGPSTLAPTVLVGSSCCRRFQCAKVAGKEEVEDDDDDDDDDDDGSGRTARRRRLCGMGNNDDHDRDSDSDGDGDGSDEPHLHAFLTDKDARQTLTVPFPPPCEEQLSCDDHYLAGGEYMDCCDNNDPYDDKYDQYDEASYVSSQNHSNYGVDDQYDDEYVHQHNYESDNELDHPFPGGEDYWDRGSWLDRQLDEWLDQSVRQLERDWEERCEREFVLELDQSEWEKEQEEQHRAMELKKERVGWRLQPDDDDDDSYYGFVSTMVPPMSDTCLVDSTTYLSVQATIQRAIDAYYRSESIQTLPADP